MVVQGTHGGEVRKELMEHVVSLITSLPPASADMIIRNIGRNQPELPSELSLTTRLYERDREFNTSTAVSWMLHIPVRPYIATLLLKLPHRLYCSASPTRLARRRLISRMLTAIGNHKINTEVQEDSK